ncbi:MAG: hypothetical protein ACJ748_13010 [Flavisolibacter sp.]
MTALESFKILLCLTKSEKFEERSFVKFKNPFFVYEAQIHWRIIVLELCKLFSDKENEHYNLNKFISRLKKGGHFADAEINDSSIEVWKAQLRKENKKIGNLILQRDKLFAHTDRSKGKVANNVTIGKTRELVKMVQQIIKEIYLTVFKSSILIDEPISSPVENLEQIIDILATWLCKYYITY